MDTTREHGCCSRGVCVHKQIKALDADNARLREELAAAEAKLARVAGHLKASLRVIGAFLANNRRTSLGHNDLQAHVENTLERWEDAGGPSAALAAIEGGESA